MRPTTLAVDSINCGCSTGTETNTLTDGPDEFEKIIASQPGETQPVPTSPWMAIKQNWSNWSDGIPVQGITIIEYVDDDGNRSLRWEMGPDMAEWHALGMVHSVLSDLQMGNLAGMFTGETEEDEEDE